jgi:alkanesulfonate monooxygenase SsuD/methylene tetrahydromethanopterin reductase-like flavin-dependent oxidoreductase (luciferase family)
VVGQPFSHHGAHYSFDGVQLPPPPLRQPRIPVWVSAMTRNRHRLGRAARWDDLLLGARSAEGGMEVLPAEAVAKMTARPDAPGDIIVAAPAGTDPAMYEDTGATWVLITDWLDGLRRLASAPALGSMAR